MKEYMEQLPCNYKYYNRKMKITVISKKPSTVLSTALKTMKDCLSQTNWQILDSSIHILGWTNLQVV